MTTFTTKKFVTTMILTCVLLVIISIVCLKWGM